MKAPAASRCLRARQAGTGARDWRRDGQSAGPAEGRGH